MTRLLRIALAATSGALALALALAGCASSDPATPGAPSPRPTPPGSTSPGGTSSAPGLISRNWILDEATDATGGLALGGATVTLKVSRTSAGGQGPCNAFGATITQSTNAGPGLYTGDLHITVATHTELACANPPLNAVEGRYFAALGRVTKASLTSSRLVLTGPGVELDFEQAR